MVEVACIGCRLIQVLFYWRLREEHAEGSRRMVRRDHRCEKENAVPSLSSFGRPVRALVVGASGAIGSALVDLLADCRDVESIVACSRTAHPHASPQVEPRTIDILDEASIATALRGIEALDLAIVATGRLHSPAGMQPEKSWRALDKATLLKSFAINTVGPALVAKHVLPLLPREGKAVFAALSARVGSISDNHLGGWYGYRASKAALNQLIRTLSIELARQHPSAVCIGLHPGTVDSALSQPFQTRVTDGKLFTPHFDAERLFNVIDGIDASQTGQLLAWDGRVILP
jgi:NAD(P)-dependent dehydrogenase (short-subunit alcohol dehydrogenase family)